MTLNLNRKLVVSFALVGVLASANSYAAGGPGGYLKGLGNAIIGKSSKAPAKEENKCEQKADDLVVAPPPPSSSCDAEKFIRATGCEGRTDLWSKRFVNRIKGGDFNYCKQYNGTPFAVLTTGDDGDVVVVNKASCAKTTYKADKSGVSQLKVVGGFVYFTAKDGELYIVDAKGRIFEIKSKRGNAYSKANGSGVLDIKGDGSNSKILHVTNQSGRFDLTAGEIQSSDARYDLLATTQDGDFALPPPPMGDDEKELTAATAGDDAEAIAPPPPGGRYGDDDFGRAKDIDAPSYWSQTAYGDLGDCDGSLTVDRVDSTTVDISFSARQCSRVEFDAIDGVRYDETKKLDTSYKPYTGSYRVYGNGYVRRNKAKITLHSKSGSTGVVYYVHF